MWAVWAAVVIGFFSVSRSKLPGYVQPAVPALVRLLDGTNPRLQRTVRNALRRIEPEAGRR